MLSQSSAWPLVVSRDEDVTKDQLKIVSWNTVKVIASTGAGIVFAIGFMMTVLGWRFTGNSDDIRLQAQEIADLKKRVIPLEEQARWTNFMLCPVYQKALPDAPVPPVCPEKP